VRNKRCRERVICGWWKKMWTVAGRWWKKYLEKVENTNVGEKERRHF